MTVQGRKQWMGNWKIEKESYEKLDTVKRQEEKSEINEPIKK